MDKLELVVKELEERLKRSKEDSFIYMSDESTGYDRGYESCLESILEFIKNLK